MFSDGTVIIGTGDDDLREGSRVWVRIYLRDRPPVIFEAAGGGRFPDRTDTSPIPWSLSPSHRPPVRSEDIERIEVAFVPDSRDFMEDDQWRFTKLILTVNDTTAGSDELYRNESIAHKFERAGTWSSGLLPTYSVSGSTIIRVFDDFGRTVPDAEVFISSNRVGETDSSGQLVVPNSSLGLFPSVVDIVVRRRIHQQDYYRSNHDFDSTENWNYRVYHTNVSISNSGIATPEWGPFPSVVDITVRRDNTLIGLNLLVSVEWDLSLTDLATLEDIIKNCSVYLYNATDGQFFIEVAQITDRRDLWDDSDFRVFADLNYRANVPNVRGGFLGHNVLGSAMKMSRRNRAATYAHEFGHYGFAVRDEYENGNSAVCTANIGMPGSAFWRGQAQASCMMWNQRLARKLCSTHLANPHSTNTEQGDEACWDTIIRRYNTDIRWNLRTPVDRGVIPGTIRYRGGGPLQSAFMLPTIHYRLRADLFGLLGGVILTVEEEGGAPVSGVVAKTREPGGSWITQGNTDSAGNLKLVGVHTGDRLRLEAGSGLAFERDVPSSLGDNWTVPIPL